MAVVIRTIATATLTAGGTAQVITGTHQTAMRAYICCPSGNTANIWIGDSSVSASGKRGMEIAKGTTQLVCCDDNDIFDLASIYFDGTTNDKCAVTYLIDPAG